MTHHFLKRITVKKILKDYQNVDTKGLLKYIWKLNIFSIQEQNLCERFLLHANILIMKNNHFTGSSGIQKRFCSVLLTPELHLQAREMCYASNSCTSQLHPCKAFTCSYCSEMSARLLDSSKVSQIISKTGFCWFQMDNYFYFNEGL